MDEYGAKLPRFVVIRAPLSGSLTCTGAKSAGREALLRTFSHLQLYCLVLSGRIKGTGRPESTSYCMKNVMQAARSLLAQITARAGQLYGNSFSH